MVESTHLLSAGTAPERGEPRYPLRVEPAAGERNPVGAGGPGNATAVAGVGCPRTGASWSRGWFSIPALVLAGWMLGEGARAASGPRRIRDLGPAAFNVSVSLARLVSYQGQVCFFAQTESSGLGFWRTDGGDTAPVLVRDLGSSRLALPGPVEFADRLYFVLSTRREGTVGPTDYLDLWASNGTPEGTILVRELSRHVVVFSEVQWTPTSQARALSVADFGAPLKEGKETTGVVDCHEAGLEVTRISNGALLVCMFQRLGGEATSEGLWLSSANPESPKGRFRVKAAALGRQFSTCSAHGDESPFRGEKPQRTICDPPSARADSRRPWGEQRLPCTGAVAIEGNAVRYVRPGLVEEYTVSVDGVRQDFVILERPAGQPLPAMDHASLDAIVDPMHGAALSRLTSPALEDGELRLELSVDGARVESSGNGVRLVLAESGRAVAYGRLRVADKTGRELPARMESFGATGGKTVNSRSPLMVMVDDKDAVYPIRIDPTFSDANWMSLGGLPGANSTVYASAVDGSGNLYIGGAFTNIGDTFANRIAKWDGNGWSPLGAGMNNDVRSLVASGGNLYAGGRFTTAGGVPANYVAKWDGNNWSALGAGMNHFVAALAASGDDLYAGGCFTTAGGVPANRVAKWNGGSWTGLGAGIDSSVSSLAVSGGNLFAGGAFTKAGGVVVNRIARWAGSSWSALGAGVNSNVESLAVSGGDVYAGGLFSAAGGVQANRVAKWNGSSWSALGAGIRGNVHSLVVFGGEVFAGGDFALAGGVSASQVARWDGSSWSALGSDVNGSVVCEVSFFKVRT